MSFGALCILFRATGAFRKVMIDSSTSRALMKSQSLMHRCDEKRHSTRWLNGTLLSPNWRSLNRLKGHSTMPEKATLNHQLVNFLLHFYWWHLLIWSWMIGMKVVPVMWLVLLRGFILLRNSREKGNHQHEAPTWSTNEPLTYLKMFLLFPSGSTRCAFFPRRTKRRLDKAFSRIFSFSMETVYCSRTFRGGLPGLAGWPKRHAIKQE